MRNTYIKPLAILAAGLGLFTSILPASAQLTTVVPAVGTTWKYIEADVSSASWTTLGYDDSAWLSGPSGFAFETGANDVSHTAPPATTLIRTTLTNPANDVGGARHAEYFRKKFNWPGVTAGAIMVLHTRWDDSGVIYLNGNPIFNNTGATLPLGFLQYTRGAIGSGTEGTVDEAATVDVSAFLLTGENVLAAEMHQVNNGSSDRVFVCEAGIGLPVAPVITDTTQPTNRIVIATRSSTLVVVANGFPAPSYQWFLNDSPITDATNSTYTIASMTPLDAGNYYASVSNPAGSVDSRKAIVTYTDDSTPPMPVSARQNGPFNTVVVTFNEAVTKQSAENQFTYNVTDGVNETFPGPVPTLSPDGMSVTVIYDTDLLPGTLYTMTVADIYDLSGNFMPTPVNIQFSTLIPTDCGGVLFESYTGLIYTPVPPATTVPNVISNLTGNVKFPNSPDIVTRLPSFAAGAGAGENFGDNYGGRMRALFLPIATANYIFYISADDSSQLFINPTGPSPAGKVLVQQDGGCCGNFTAHPTVPIAMTAGRAYYIEAIYQEGGGGDYCYVAVRKQGEAAPVGRSELDAIPGSLLGSPAAPANVAGTVAITTQPANQTAVPNSTATFSVGTSTDALKCYQWYRGTDPIPNAVNSQYSLTVTPADNGAVFHVVVSIIAGNTVTSGNATLTVAADTIRPTVLSVAANAPGTQITVTYSEPMDLTSAASAANYTIAGVAPSSVTLDGSATVATLVLAAPLATGGCTLSEVRISGVKDAAIPTGNFINPNPYTVSLSSPFIEVLALGATWKYNDSGTDLGTSWSATAFNDSAWLSGPAPFGFETALPAAQIPVIATPIAEVTKTNTAYFRTHFILGVNPATIAVLQMSAVVDDAAVFYLNGVEAGRLRMPDAPAVITAATLATGGSPEPVNGTHTFEAINIAKTALVAGDNVLAVELHPTSASSDSEFGASIRIVVCVPTLVVQHVGSQVKLTWSDAAYRLETAPSVTGPWTAQAGASGLQVPATPNNAFFRLVTP